MHDAKIMEQLIIINLVGDKGYIKQIKDMHNITLITSLRGDSKKKIVKLKMKARRSVVAS